MATNNFTPQTLNLKIVTGGALGTMTVSDNIASSSPVQLSSSAAPYSYNVRSGPPCIVDFPAGTYVAGDVYSWNPGDSVPVRLGTGAPVPTVRSLAAAPQSGGASISQGQWP